MIALTVFLGLSPPTKPWPNWGRAEVQAWLGQACCARAIPRRPRPAIVRPSSSSPPTTGFAGPGRSILLGAFGLLILPSSAQAQAPPNYVAAFLGTTPAYRPPGGPWEGFQHDLTAAVGYGRYITKTLALELDLGPTWIRGDYASFSLTPGLVWSFNPHAYAAARFIVPVDPETNFALYPGLGLIHTFASGLAPLLEMNLVSVVGRGDPDLAVSVTVGVLFSF